MSAEPKYPWCWAVFPDGTRRRWESPPPPTWRTMKDGHWVRYTLGMIVPGDDGVDEACYGEFSCERPTEGQTVLYR